MIDSCIYKGKIVEKIDNATYKVLLPNDFGIVPIGSSERIGKNTGSDLYGKAYQDAKASALICKICTPLTSGSWFTYDEAKGLSVFSNKKTFEKEDYVDYRLYPDWQQRQGNGMRNLEYKSSLPAFNNAVVQPILSQSGGIPIPNTGNLPKGIFPELKVDQDVLVAKIKGTTNGIILGSLPSDREIKAMLG